MMLERFVCLYGKFFAFLKTNRKCGGWIKKTSSLNDLFIFHLYEIITLIFVFGIVFHGRETSVPRMYLASMLLVDKSNDGFENFLICGI